MAEIRVWPKFTDLPVCMLKHEHLKFTLAINRYSCTGTCPTLHPGTVVRTCAQNRLQTAASLLELTCRLRLLLALARLALDLVGQLDLLVRLGLLLSTLNVLLGLVQLHALLLHDIDGSWGQCAKAQSQLSQRLEDCLGLEHDANLGLIRKRGLVQRIGKVARSHEQQMVQYTGRMVLECLGLRDPAARVAAEPIR